MPEETSISYRTNIYICLADQPRIPDIANLDIASSGIAQLAVEDHHPRVCLGAVTPEMELRRGSEMQCHLEHTNHIVMLNLRQYRVEVVVVDESM